MSNSIKLAKPPKPYSGFPLFSHSNGKWAKKIRGKMHYFGRWDDPDAALASYTDQADDLHAGRTPRARSDGLTIQDLCNEVLGHKDRLVKEGELSRYTYDGCLIEAKCLCEVLGKKRLVEDLAQADFTKLRSKYAETCGPGGIASKIRRVKAIFNYAYKTRMIDKPVWYGVAFDLPSKRAVQKAKNELGPMLFSVDEIHMLLNAASTTFRAMLLLGINAAFGQSDCSNLPAGAVDLKGGWIEFPRPKNAEYRRCKLWPETVDAIREALANQPNPASKDATVRKVLFLRKDGLPWKEPGGACNITRAMRRLTESVGVWQNYRGFYSLRRTFRTIADETLDNRACDLVMGHRTRDMASHYVKTISDERLIAVTDHVRRWLWPDAK